MFQPWWYHVASLRMRANLGASCGGTMGDVTGALPGVQVCASESLWITQRGSWKRRSHGAAAIINNHSHHKKHHSHHGLSDQNIMVANHGICCLKCVNISYNYSIYY